LPNYLFVAFAPARASSAAAIRSNASACRFSTLRLSSKEALYFRQGVSILLVRVAQPTKVEAKKQ
jgi:hypothetical protein